MFTLFQLATAGKTRSRHKILCLIVEAFAKGRANRGKNHAIL